MTVKEFYDRIGGGYEDAVSLLRKEERIAKYLGMFLNDDSFQLLKDGMESGDMEKAFRGAHTLQGVTANLGLAKLRKLASDLTEDLRGGCDIEHAKAAFPEVAACYEHVIGTIREFKEEQS